MSNNDVLALIAAHFGKSSYQLKEEIQTIVNLKRQEDMRKNPVKCFACGSLELTKSGTVVTCKTCGHAWTDYLN
ncbi:hypothetical protein [Anabaena sp. CCY 0017]|uniref:hypothetical protein n=1 Tax=Anabaena sp. CCY 0017 TaxID=3103866 RepID=UPI0039C66648